MANITVSVLTTAGGSFILTNCWLLGGGIVGTDANGTEQHVIEERIEQLIQH